MVYRPYEKAQERVTERVMEYMVQTENHGIITCVAHFTDFGCTINFLNGLEDEFVCDGAWSQYVYNSLKQKETFMARKISEFYKRDHDEHITKIKKNKIKLAREEYTRNRLK